MSTGGDDRGHCMTLWTESTDDRSLQEVMTEDIGWHSELRVQMTYVYTWWWQRTLYDTLNWEYRWHMSTGGDDRGHYMTLWTESTDDISLQEVLTEDIGWHSELRVQMTESKSYVYGRWWQRTLDDTLNWEYRWHKSTGGDDRGHWMTLWTESTDDICLQEVMTEDIRWHSELRVQMTEVYRRWWQRTLDDIGWLSELRVHMTEVYRRWWQRTLDDTSELRVHVILNDICLQEVMTEDIGWHSELRVQMTEVYRRWWERTLDDTLNWEYRWQKSTGGDDRGHWMTFWTESTDDISLQEVMTEDIGWHSELRVQMT